MPAPPSCFTPGTRCAAPHGDVLVEDVRVGDELLVQTGLQLVPRPVVWVGSRCITPKHLSSPELSAPIRISASAIADGVPARDVVISPDHRILVAGHLVPSRLLVNEMSIRREPFARPITYLHIEFATHSVMIVEGMPAESFLDEQNDRSFFDTGSDIAALRPVLPNLNDPSHSARACAPLAMTPAASRDVWQTLFDRAIALGYVAPARTISADPELYLLADSTPVFPIQRSSTEATFVLRTSPVTLRLISRASSPSQIDRDADDWRILGVAVREICYRSADSTDMFAADNPVLNEGWQDVESDSSGAWRWTNGNARLPRPNGSVTVTVRFFAQPAYLTNEPVTTKVSRAA